MNFRKTAIIAAALSLGAAPVAAQTATPQIARASAETTDANGQINGSWILPGIIFVGVIAALVVIFTGEDDDSSVSA